MRNRAIIFRDKKRSTNFVLQFLYIELQAPMLCFACNQLRIGNKLILQTTRTSALLRIPICAITSLAAIVADNSASLLFIESTISRTLSSCSARYDCQGWYKNVRQPQVLRASLIARGNSTYSGISHRIILMSECEAGK